MLRLLGAVALLSAVVAALACDGEETPPDSPPAGGPSRSFAMGLSSLPSELTDAGYGQAFELAAQAGEVVLIKRVPPWGALLNADGFPSEDVVAATQRERQLADDHGLETFFAMDPTGRTTAGELADLPEELRGAGFADERIRSAFVRYAQYVAANYQPLFLALGVEVNSYEAENPEDFEQFLTLYAEAYDAVKELSPDTVVFPTFQLEEMHGLLPLGEPRAPQWNLIGRFAPRLDLIGLSVYPDAVFSDPQRVPREYLSRASDYADVPIAIAEMGYTSDTTRQDAQGEDLQALFLARMVQEAERLRMPLAVWFVGQDATFTGAPPFDQLGGLGLLRTDGSEKRAWEVWRNSGQAPLDPREADDS
jgi:hypothetical protein